jgi:uncharacterized protein YggE
MTRTLNALMKPAALAGAAAAAVALAAGAPPAMAQTAPQAPAPQAPAPLTQMQPAPSLNLSAFGEVKTAPDMATITFGVQTEAATAEAAMRANAERMNQVMSALRRAGIAERHVQTSGLNLSAQYDYQENQPPRLRGYQAVNRVTVRIEDLTKVGSTADAVVAAGVNQIDGIGFGLKDPTTAENEARRLAVRALQEKAALYAQALGVQLGGVRTLSEGGGYSPPPPMPMYARAVSLQSADSSPVSGGELAVRIDITGVYDIVR